MPDTPTNDSDFKHYLRERLEFPKAVLSQLRESCLFNDMIDSAIGDLDEVIKLLSETEVSIDKS